MDERKKVRVTVNQNYSDHKKHDLENFLTPKSNKKQARFLSVNGRTVFAKMVKPIILAIILGGIFGASLVYFFSDITPNNDAVPVTNIDQGEDNDESTNDQNEDSSITMTERNFNVIQFGVFSTRENADDLIRKTLEPLSIPAVILNQNGKYYVLSHAVFSEQEKNEITTWLEGNQLIYMTDFLYKSWGFPPVNVQSSNSEQTWLEEGDQLLNSFTNRENNAEWISSISQWLGQSSDAYSNNEYIIKTNELIQKMNSINDETLKNFYLGSVMLSLSIFLSNLA